MIIKQEKAKTLSTLLAGLGVGLFPTLSFGLGLGDIQIESRLNQRLHARIEVVDVSDEEWQRIRARIAPRTLLSEAAVHPEILDSLNLRAIEDANHRHFIEVTSVDALTEPLFDLPVAVSGVSLQVVRNYSVLLDPASLQDAPPQGSTVPMLAQQAAPQSAGSAQDARGVGSSDTAGGRPAAAARADAPAHVAAPKRATRHHRSRLARRHSSSSHRVAAAINKSDVAAKGADQQVEGQLATLQQMLTQMQATIAAQDAEIAKLKEQVAARTESQVPRTVPVPQVEAATELSDEATSPARTRGFRNTHPLVYRLAGIVGGMVVLALGAVAFIRRRHSISLREIHPRESARKDAPSGAEPRSDMLAWQSSLREAQSGTWRSPMRSTNSKVDDTAAIHVEESHFDSDSSSESEHATSHSASVDPEVTTVATTVAMEELTANLEADLEALSASYESEHLQTSTGVLDEWLAQKEMLERDYLSDTEALPFVLDEGNRARSVATTENPTLALKAGGDEPTEEQPIPAQRGAGNDPVAEISEQPPARAVATYG